MKTIRKVMKWLGVLVLVALLGGVVGIFAYGRPPAQRPDLVTALPEGVPAPPPGWPSEITSFIAGYLLHEHMVTENGPPVAGVTMTADIQYGTGDGTPLFLDLYKADTTKETAPGLVLFYGGGWRGGRKDQLRSYAQYFAQHGYVVATPQYRLKEAGEWPRSVHDAKAAMRWMRAHAAENGVDPNRIGVMGNSAGAYLALMVGYTPGVAEFEGSGGNPEQSSVAQAVVDIYGPTDFTDPKRRDHPLILAYMHGAYEGNKERFEKASPIRYVTEKTPPTCVIHGTVDMLVPVRQSDWLVEALKKNNVPHLYSRIDGWPHAMDIVTEVSDHTKALIVKFFDEHLKNRGA